MSTTKTPPGGPIEVESTDRWVAGKNEEELIADLRVYLARLRDNPHSLIDRLRVAAIQLRLGRVQEALIHYEGVLRGYVAEGQVMSAIALCQRILAIYPDLPRIQRILAALYARAPRGATGAPAAVTPVESLEERPTTTFVVNDRDAANKPVVVSSVFPEGRRSPVDRRGRDLLEASEDLRPTVPYHVQPRGQPAVDLDAPTKLEGPKTEPPIELVVAPRDKSGAGPAPDGEVVLLTKPKKKKR